MTTLILDNPELIARAAIAAGYSAATLEATVKKPHRMKFHYGFNQHSLNDDDMAFLKQHAFYLTQSPSVTVRIHGHSDNFGSEGYNQFLSRLRANAVARVLMKEGVPESRLLITCWGSARPLTRQEDRAANRRVELEYLTLDVARAL